MRLTGFSQHVNRENSTLHNQSVAK